MYQAFLIALVSIVIGVISFPYNSLAVFVVIMIILHMEEDGKIKITEDRVRTPQKIVIFQQREIKEQPVMEKIKEQVVMEKIKEQKKITSLDDVLEPIDYLKDIEFPDMSEAAINEDAMAWKQIECR
jgi:hypothetical protein